jgi:hypothetical protein
VTTRWEPRVAPPLAPVLDIGGEVGAMVVYLAACPPSGEIEACPQDEPEARFHTGVHHRTVGIGVGGAADEAWVAVFPEVIEGSYYLLDADGLPLAGMTVTGGTVDELDLR